MEQLIKIQSELKCPKGNFNAFGKYKYRSAEQILEAVKPLLSKYKCTLTIKDDVFELGATHVLKATAIFSNGTDKIEVTGLAGIDYNMKGMSIPQMYGSSSSYSRKYALNGLFLIDETEADADSQEPKKEEKKASTPDTKKEPAKVDLIAGTENCQKVITYLAGGGKIEEVQKKYNISETLLKELTK
jgi:hypothetical protein